MIAISSRHSLNASNSSNYSPMMTVTHASAIPPSPTGAGSSPASEEMNPIAMAINCMNGEIKQESIISRSLQQMCGGSTQQVFATSSMPPTPPQQQQSLMATMLSSQHSNGSPAPPSPVVSAPNANLIFSTATSSPAHPEFVQLSIPEDHQLLEMAAAEAGIVAPIMTQDPNQQQQQQQTMTVISKSNGQMEQQLQEFGPGDFLPISTQNQTLSQMVATYATNDMSHQDILAPSNQQYHQQQYLVDQQQEMMQNYYYGNHQQLNTSHDEGVIMSTSGVGEVPHTPTFTTSSQMGGEPMSHQMMDSHNNNHCGRRGQFQTPPPLQSVGPITNIPSESLQSPDSGYGDICSTPKESSTNMYHQHTDRFFHDTLFHQQQQQQQQQQHGNYVPNGMMYSTLDTSQMSPIGSLPSPVKSAHNNSTLMNTSMDSTFPPSSPEIKQETPMHKPSAIPSLRIAVPQVQIEKINDPYGFNYQMDTPISTAQRVDEDRMTYVNKGQFYPLTVNYVPYPNHSDNLKTNAPVKTVVMAVFREEKNQDNELKAWGFWHARQHSIKQRILDADSKTASGILGSCEEIAHNAIAFHWSPKEGPAKLSVAVQCLSTDFSNQKGVKGSAMHLQIDTYATDTNSRHPLHRAYAQIKVFCDKGAERKTRDEERRILKRKQNHAGRRKIEDLYHPKCDKTEFYQMADLVTSPVIFNPSEHNGYMVSRVDINAANVISSSVDNSSTSSYLKRGRDESLLDNNGNIIDDSISPPLAKRLCYMPQRSARDEKVIIQIKDHKTNTSPLTVTPPTLEGLANALEAKYNIQANLVEHIYKRSCKGALVLMDNDLLRYYGSKGEFKLDVATTDESKYRVTLVAVK